MVPHKITGAQQIQNHFSIACGIGDNLHGPIRQKPDTIRSVSHAKEDFISTRLF
ncbi:MAG: hypothetical protein NVSMB3_11130 [Acidobacteriaceae bacterium]